jgi:hypothetical protein
VTRQPGRRYNSTEMTELENTPDKAGERERVLAAVGWEGDPRRRRVLRRLLQEQYERIYLHCYAATHNRHSAMDGTRRALLGVARTLDQVPEKCPLAAWVFLQVRATSSHPPECPEPWRILTESDQAGSAAADLERHREVHPGCGELLAAYRAYLQMPQNAALVTRAGWPTPAGDLDRYLEAQFGEENPQAVRPSDYWRQLLRSFRWSRSGLAGALVILAVAILAVVLLTEWRGGILPRHDHEGGQTAKPSIGLPKAVRPASPELALISGAAVKVDKAGMDFHWEPVTGAQQYRLSILTAKLAGLHTIDQLRECSAHVVTATVSGLVSGESYLFRVDGLKNGAVVASSGYQPFELP